MSWSNLKILVGKLLIIACIYYHIYVTMYDPMQNKRFDLNSKNNLHKYFHSYPDLFAALAVWVTPVTLCSLGCSILMLISKHMLVRVITLLGIALYNTLILNYHIIVPNYYVLREWVGIAGGVVAIAAL